MFRTAHDSCRIARRKEIFINQLIIKARFKRPIQLQTRNRKKCLICTVCIILYYSDTAEYKDRKIRSLQSDS